jgi:uncharacterized protein (DUF39 family)
MTDGHAAYRRCSVSRNQGASLVFSLGVPVDLLSGSVIASIEESL